MDKPSFIHDPAHHSVRRSVDLHARALPTIPGAAQTFSKSASQMAMGVSPLLVTRAEGSRVWDADEAVRAACAVATKRTRGWHTVRPPDSCWRHIVKRLPCVENKTHLNLYSI